MPDSPAHTIRDPWLWHLLLVLAVSAAFESLFLQVGLGWLDGPWPLYAAKRLHAGGALYDDALWVFPPGHVIPGWLGYHFDPPGILLTRYIYAAFNVALCGALYLLGRRFMPASFALLGALLLAVAAPHSHYKHLLFGYRYLVLALLALFAFERRLRGGGPRWMLAAGVCTGVALFFRLTPAFSVACGIGVAVLAADRSPRRWLVDWGGFAAGIVAVMLPVLLWFAGGVGLTRLFTEVVIHPLGMLQPLPLPPLEAPVWSDRESLTAWWTALRMRAGWLIYGGYALGLAALWLRSLRRREPFPHALLLAVVVFGAVFFIRSLGRSDEPHLDSVIAPLCLLTAHLISLVFAALWPAHPGRRRLRSAGEIAVAGLALLAWIHLSGSDLYLDIRERAVHRVRFTGDPIHLKSRRLARWMRTVGDILRKRTQPDDTILCMGPTPLFYLLADRLGPGYHDIVMPGTFLTPEDERRFVERLESSPPAAVVWSERSFDRMAERSPLVTAPLLSAWVLEHYRAPPGRAQRRWLVMLPIPDGAPATAVPPAQESM